MLIVVLLGRTKVTKNPTAQVIAENQLIKSTLAGGKELSLQQLLRPHRRLHLEHFLSYAPELNPDEGVLAQRFIYVAINKCKLVQVNVGLSNAGGGQSRWVEGRA
jgi:hypothetical protein